MRVSLVALIALVIAAPVTAAQDTTRIPQGVRLGTRYTVGRKPVLAVRNVEGAGSLIMVAQQITGILQRDLDYSDRFEIVATPQALATGPVNYSQWNSLNVVYLVTSQLAPAASGYELSVTLHDVPFSAVKQTQSFRIPNTGDPAYRMAVHAVSDELVKWMTGKPGAAASRIVYTRQVGSTFELMIVDSDGENPRRLVSANAGIYSPALSIDGRKVAYSVREPNGRIVLRERDVGTGQERVISSRGALSYTPAYSPDGKRLAFSFDIGSGTEIHDYDLERNCCLRRITKGPRDDLGPSYSGDGQRIVFSSSRLGMGHIFVASAEGGDATMLTPYSSGQRIKFVAPDWSPTSDEIVFHGESRGGFHLMVADARRPGLAEQITSTGSNEDPSWAPDGRHIVYTGVGSQGSGLYVIDRESGRVRLLTGGARLKMAEWSGRLGNGAPASAGN